MIVFQNENRGKLILNNYYYTVLKFRERKIKKDTLQKLFENK